MVHIKKSFKKNPFQEKSSSDIFIFLLNLSTLMGCGSVEKNLPANAGDVGSIPGLERSPGEGNGKPTPVFLPGKFHNRRVWRATVHGVTESHTPLSTHR